MPPAASVHAHTIDSLIAWIAGITIFFTVLVHLLLGIAIWRFRRARGLAPQTFTGNATLEWIWTIVPAAILLMLAVASERLWQKYRAVSLADDPQAATILVIGQQFKWSVIYPGPDGKIGRYLVFPKITDAEWPHRNDDHAHLFRGTPGPASLPPKAAQKAIDDFISQPDPAFQLGKDFSDPNGRDDDLADAVGRPLYLPLGRPVKILVMSRDVIHDLYLPNFRTQLYAVPGIAGSMAVTPTTPGNCGEMICGQLCGNGHALMHSEVIVLPAAEYHTRFETLTPSLGTLGEGGDAGGFERKKAQPEDPKHPHPDPLPGVPGEGARTGEAVKRLPSLRDHKTLGITFLFASLLFCLLGGGLAMVMRWKLAYPQSATFGGMLPDTYNILFTLHATVMIYFVIVPMGINAFGNFLVPLKIGADQLSLPRAGAISFWLWLLAGAVLLSGIWLTGGGAASGWTAYAPLSNVQFNGGGSMAFTSGWPVACDVICSLIAGYCGLQIADCGFELNSIRIPQSAIRNSSAAVVAILTFLLLPRIAFDGQSCWIVSLLLFGISSLLGAINLIATIIARRQPDMPMMRLPLSVWSMLIAAFILLLATPVLSAALLMSLLDHHRITHFFEPTMWVDSGHLTSNADGLSMLWPHLFWFYGHPVVYVMILPAMGIVGDVLPTFSRKPIFGYRWVIASMTAIAGLGFIVWGHHLYQSGLNPTIGNAFAFSSMIIAVPSGIETFSWIATMWGGSIWLTASMLSAISFVSLFVIGGMSGVFLASTAVDAHLHNTYFVVAHIHYVLFGGSLFGLFAGTYFWFPRMFRRHMNETAGRWHIVLSYVFFNLTFFTMHLLGLAGMPRRISDMTGYTSLHSMQWMNVFITHSAWSLGAVQLVFVFNFLLSLRWGRKAESNPWESDGLEWTNVVSHET